MNSPPHYSTPFNQHCLPVCTANIAARLCCLVFSMHVVCLEHRHHVVTTLAAQSLILEGTLITDIEQAQMLLIHFHDAD